MKSKTLLPRFLAGTLAVASLFALLLGPMWLYRVISGIPLDGHGPKWEIWLLVVGGAAGAGLARAVHHLVLTKCFGFNEHNEDRAWKGQ